MHNNYRLLDEFMLGENLHHLQRKLLPLRNNTWLVRVVEDRIINENGKITLKRSGCRRDSRDLHLAMGFRSKKYANVTRVYMSQFDRNQFGEWGHVLGNLPRNYHDGKVRTTISFSSKSVERNNRGAVMTTKQMSCDR